MCRWPVWVRMLASSGLKQTRVSYSLALTVPQIDFFPMASQQAAYWVSYTSVMHWLQEQTWAAKYHSKVPLNHFFPMAKECKFRLFLSPWWTCDFSMVNSCLKDCIPPQSPCSGNSLLGTHVCISFEQEHFAPVDVLLFNCSQLFSLLLFSFSKA